MTFRIAAIAAAALLPAIASASSMSPMVKASDQSVANGVVAAEMAVAAENGWLVCDATPDLVFRTDDDRKWEAALATLGVSAVALSSEGGRA